MGGDLRDFLDVVGYVYRDDPCYVRSLDLDLGNRLGKRNPFFDHGEAVAFTAHKNGWCVGRATASIDRSHLELYRDDTGFFGFFDTIDDPEVASALLDAARTWLRDRGMRRVRGPLSLNMNEEVGCLVEGFDTPPMMLMTHHRPYQGGLIEGAGLQKVKDLYAWRYSVGDVPKRAQKAHDEISAYPEVRTRNVDKRHLERDLRLIMDVFNDAWSENWGFVPLSQREVVQMGKDLKPIYLPELSLITEIDGEPAAVALALPNVNEVIRDLDGKLFPLGLPKLLYRLKIRGTRTARLMILGIKKKYRAVRRYAGLSIYLYVRMNAGGLRTGIETGELSWTLEDNGPVNVAIKMMGGSIYKRYRLYEGAL